TGVAILILHRAPPIRRRPESRGTPEPCDRRRSRSLQGRTPCGAVNEGEAVLDHVRPAVGETLHVRGLDADADPSGLSVVRADAAPVLVSAQHRRSEPGIAPGAPGIRLDGPRLRD